MGEGIGHYGGVGLGFGIGERAVDALLERGAEDLQREISTVVDVGGVLGEEGYGFGSVHSLRKHEGAFVGVEGLSDGC